MRTLAPLVLLAAATVACEERLPVRIEPHVAWTDDPRVKEDEDVPVVATVGHDAHDLAAGDRDLFFAEGSYSQGPSRIMTVPKEGGPVRVLHGIPGPIRTLATDGAHVYWIDGGTGAVARIPAQGGPEEQVYAGAAEGMILDGDAVYLTEPVPEQGSRLLRVPKGGGSAAVLVERLHQPSRLTATADRLFWVDRPEHLVRVPFSMGGRDVLSSRPWPVVMSIRKTGGDPLTFEETRGGNPELVGGGGRAYFGNHDGFFAWDPAAGAAAKWPLHALRLEPAIADERGVYSIGNGWLCRLTPDKAVPIWLAKDYGDSYFLVVDATYVYWIRGPRVFYQHPGPTTLRRVAKW